MRLYTPGMESLEDVDTIKFDRYGPGKFSNNVEEFVYECVAAGFSKDTTGDEYFGTYDLVTFGKPITVLQDGNEWSFVAAIITYTDQGFVNVETYEDNQEAMDEWKRVQEEYEKEAGREENPSKWQQDPPRGSRLMSKDGNLYIMNEYAMDQDGRIDSFWYPTGEKTEDWFSRFPEEGYPAKNMGNYYKANTNAYDPITGKPASFRVRLKAEFVDTRIVPPPKVRPGIKISWNAVSGMWEKASKSTYPDKEPIVWQEEFNVARERREENPSYEEFTENPSEENPSSGNHLYYVVAVVSDDNDPVMGGGTITRDIRASSEDKAIKKFKREYSKRGIRILSISAREY